MGLLSNGYRHFTKGNLFGATALNGANPSVLPSRFNQAAPIRNQFIGEGVTSKLAAQPSGHLHPSAWVMPQKPGAMSSRYEAVISVGATGAGVSGYPIEGSTSFSITTNNPTIFPLDDTSPLRTGSASFSITTNSPDGQLIVSGGGSASFAVTTNNPLLLASLNGAGSASFSISLNTPVLGAEANLVGNATISITTNTPTMLPDDDSSPVRTALASFNFSGTLAPYAIGHMSGTTDVGDVVTNASLARAVWDSVLAEFTNNGSAGKALSTASAGGVDLEAMAAAILTAAQADPIHANVQKMNDVDVVGNGTAGNKWRGA